MASILCRGSSSRRNGSDSSSSSTRSRLLPSLALFGSFFLLGVFVSALGPAIPSISRDLGVADTSFGTAFSLRGLGYLLGSWCSSLTLPIWPNANWLNDRMIRLGAATGGMGLFTVALDAAPAFWSACVFCLSQGFCGGAVDAIANASISAVHGQGVAPWMQGLHFCFSLGALFAPAAVGQLGYWAVFIGFGLLALPAGVACCLTATAAVAAAVAADQSARTGLDLHHMLVDESNEPSLSETSGGVCGDGGGGGSHDGGGDRSSAPRFSGGGIEMVEMNSTAFAAICPAAAAAAAMEPRRTLFDGANNFHREADPDRHEQEGRCTIEEPPLPSSADAVGSCGTFAAHKRCIEAEEAGARGSTRYQEAGRGTHPRSVLLSSDEDSSNQIDHEADLRHLHRDRGLGGDEDRPPLHSRDDEGGGRRPAIALVGLLVVFFFLYVGIEVAFGAWVAVVVLRDNLAREAGAALMASVFWGGITAGRLLAVPLAVRFSADLLVRVNLVGGLLSSTLLWIIGRDGIVWAAAGAGLFGLFMASTYPLAMSLLPSAEVRVLGLNAAHSRTRRQADLFRNRQEWKPHFLRVFDSDSKSDSSDEAEPKDNKEREYLSDFVERLPAS